MGSTPPNTFQRPKPALFIQQIAEIDVFFFFLVHSAT
jgi:hypothetical protein